MNIEKAKGHNLIYHTANGDYLTSGTMKSAEEELEKFGFSRGNKCYLINLNHVDGIQDKCAVVKGQYLQISRPRMSAFMQDLTNRRKADEYKIFRKRILVWRRCL